jgi:nitroreductase
MGKDSKKRKIWPKNPIIKALMERHSTKSFSERKLKERDLSSILWAAAGINRPEYDEDGNIIGGKLTIPTAMNRQPIIVYAVLEEGVYQYDPINNNLVLVMEGDYRADAAYQPPYHVAPLNLIFVADLTKYSGPNPGGFFPNRDELIYTVAISVGCAAQSVYLYLASTRKLGGTYRTAMNKALWHDYLGLPPMDPVNYNYPDQLVMGGMTIGYPASAD